MSRTWALLLSIAVIGCKYPVVVEDPAPLCPCQRFKLQAVNGIFLPYAPGGDSTHSVALVDDVLTFGADGRVHEISTIRTIVAHDTSVKERTVIGEYAISLPIVTVMWPDAGKFVYGLRDDSLVTGVSVRHERWTYRKLGDVTR